MIEQSEPLAAVHAQRALADLWDRDEHLTPGSAAAAFLAAHSVGYDYFDGRRRLIYRGAWEVDPAAGR